MTVSKTRNLPLDCYTVSLGIPRSPSVHYKALCPSKRGWRQRLRRTWAAYSSSWASSGSTRATSDSVVAVASLYGFRAMSNPRSFVGNNLAQAGRQAIPAFRVYFTPPCLAWHIKDNEQSRGSEHARQPPHTRARACTSSTRGQRDARRQ